MLSPTIRALARTMETETLTLAPSAGSGIGKALADALISDPEFLPLMVDAAKDSLKATRSFWCGKGGDGYLETEPDMRIRVQGLALILAHMEGEPVKRIIHQHLGGAGTIDPLAALQESPALMEAAKRLIDKAAYRTGGGARQKAAAEARRVKAAETVVEDFG